MSVPASCFAVLALAVNGIQIQHGVDRRNHQVPVKADGEASWGRMSFGNRAWHSQYGQDKWLYEKVFGPFGLANKTKNEADRPYFLEFGARNGVSLSNTNFFETRLGWQGVLIEVGMDDMQTLPKNRRCKIEGVDGSSCIHAAVSDVEGKLLDFQGEGLSGKDRKIMRRIRSPVNTTTLNAVVRDFRLPRIDLLSVDCEGCELTALKAFDFAIPVRVILVERDGGEDYFCEIKKFLTSKGFLGMRPDGWPGKSDEVFVSQEVAAAIPQPNIRAPGEHCADQQMWTVWPHQSS